MKRHGDGDVAASELLGPETDFASLDGDRDGILDVTESLGGVP